MLMPELPAVKQGSAFLNASGKVPVPVEAACSPSQLCRMNRSTRTVESVGSLLVMRTIKKGQSIAIRKIIIIPLGIGRTSSIDQRIVCDHGRHFELWVRSEVVHDEELKSIIAFEALLE